MTSDLSLATKKTSSPVRDEATRWSDLPRVIQHFTELSDKEGGGVGRLFGYASLIKDHVNEKPAGAAHIPNESATLPGMEVAMNVLAVGREYRGASGTYTNAAGQEQYFANSGLYAGLEPATSPGGYASGMNITTMPEDRNDSLKAYIKRELGKPPEGITLDDLFDSTAAPKFEALKGMPEDAFGMYKFQIVNAAINAGNTGTRQAPAITVSTNEQSRFSAIGLTPMQAAERILDGQGYRRTEGGSIKGGAALDYFQNAALGTARELNLQQPRLNATNEAVGKLADIWGQMGDIQSLKLSPAEEHKREALMYASAYAHRKDLTGLSSPLFAKDESTNNREPITPADIALPGNENMAHTAEEKFQRIAKLRDVGKLAANANAPSTSSGKSLQTQAPTHEMSATILVPPEYAALTPVHIVEATAAARIALAAGMEGETHVPTTPVISEEAVPHFSGLTHTATLKTSVSSVTRHAGTVITAVQVAGDVAGAAEALHRGDYKTAAEHAEHTAKVVGTQAAMHLFTQASTYETAAKVLEDVAEGAKMAKVVGEKLPIIGGVVALGAAFMETGTVAWEAAHGHATWTKVGSTAVANVAEIGGSAIGFGADVALRETVVYGSRKLLGEENAANHSATIQVAQLAVNGAKGLLHSDEKPAIAGQLTSDHLQQAKDAVHNIQHTIADNQAAYIPAKQKTAEKAAKAL